MSEKDLKELNSDTQIVASDDEKEKENKPQEKAFNDPHEIKNSIDGERFNKNIHAAFPDGTPKKNKSGTWQKKRGRKSGDFAQKQKQNDIDPALRGMAVQATAIFFATLETIGEEEGTPIKTETFDEFSLNAESLYNLLEKRGVKASEEMQVLLNYGGSIVSRIGKPKTSAKIKSFFFKILKPSAWNIFKKKQKAEPPKTENKRSWRKKAK